MGFDGKQVIHPSQIEPTRNAFIPSDEELAYAERAIAALEEAERNGQGAVTVDGKMVDYANIRMIKRLMSFRARLKGRGKVRSNPCTVEPWIAAQDRPSSAPSLIARRPSVG